jgi:tetratricopeptide (TPR) repeat protein
MNTDEQVSQQISIEDVKSALEHIRKGEIIKLGEHKLSDLSLAKSRVDPLQAPNSLERGKVLMSLFSEIIENLKPSQEAPDLNREDWRCYLVLKEHIYNGKSAEEVSDKVLSLGLVSFYAFKSKAIKLLTEELRRQETNFLLAQPEPLTNMNFSRPPMVTDFFDRTVADDGSSLVEKIIDLLTGQARSGIVALEGPGGIGKTVVAWEVAKRCYKKKLFSAIIWTTAKTEIISDPETLVSIKDSKYYIDSLDGMLLTIGKTIGYRRILELEGRDIYEFVLKCLNDLPVLLIIDNLESLNKSDATEIGHFIEELPNLTKVLLTSREKIQGRGEWAVEVSGLDQANSRKMIVQEAERLHVSLSEEDIEACVELSEGVPLTIQFMLSLMHSHGFDPRRAHADLLNHKSFQKYLFDHVYNQKLTDADRLVLKVLPIFEAPVKPDVIASAVELPIAHVENSLGTLYYHSLVKQVTENDEISYFIPTTIKEFVKSKILTGALDFWIRTHRLLANYYINTAKSMDMEDCIRYLKINKRNLFSTMDACYSQKNWEYVLNLAAVFCWPLGELGYTKDRESWGRMAIEAAQNTGKRHEEEWHLITDISYCHLLKGETDAAKEICQEALENSQYPEIKGLAARKLASISLYDDPDRAKILVEEALTHLQQWNSPKANYWISITKKLQAIIYSVLGDQETAIRLLEEVIEEFERNRYNLAQKIVITNILSLVRARNGEIDRALKKIEENRAFAKENDLQHALAHNYFQHGKIEMLRENYEEAATLLDESYNIYSKLGRNYYAKVVMKSLNQCEQILRAKIRNN